MSDFTDSAQSKQIDQVEHNNDASAKRVIIRYQDASDGSWNNWDPSDEATYAVRIDDSNDPIIYIGKADVGSSTSSAVWQVAKLDTTSGLVKTWADSDTNFDNVFDDRASLTYG